MKLEKTQKIIFQILQIGVACTFACAPMAWTSQVQAQEIPSTTKTKNAPGMALFVPPKGWRTADQKDLSPHVKVLVVGPKLQNDMPPTMNLMIEPYEGTLKSYLKNVKKINDSHGEDWKDLGSLKTKAGDASLSQVEVRSKWGGEKLMHAIIVRNGYAYVLTATAAKSEFGRFYQQFYNSLRSLQIYDNVLDLIEAPEKRASLENAYATILMVFKQQLQGMPSGKEEIFQSADFQNNYWKPFVNMLQRDYATLGPEWQNTVLIDLKEQLMNN